MIIYVSKKSKSFWKTLVKVLRKSCPILRFYDLQFGGEVWRKVVITRNLHKQIHIAKVFIIKYLCKETNAVEVRNLEH